MEDRDANKGLRSSWEDVYKMPDKADAAQQDCKQRQAVSEADSPKKDQAGAPEGERRSKGITAAVEDNEWILEDPTISEKDCFEGEAEVVQASQKDSSLHFEEEDTCVHPSKPNFDAEAAMDFDSTSEGDLEASSLAGSDCEYAFVLDRPNVKPGDVDKEAPGNPDKGRSMPQPPPSPPQSPQWGPRRSTQLMGPPSLQAARSGSESPAQSPGLHSPAPPCTEVGQLEEGITTAEQGECTADLPSPSAAAADEESAAGITTMHIETHSSTATEGDQINSSRTQAASVQDGQEALGSTAGLATEERYEMSRPQSPVDPNSSVPIEPVEMAYSSHLPSSLQSAAAEVAAHRRRQLDAVGVIPGGRAAFGAKLPSHEVPLESSRSAAADRRQHQAARRASAALPELARPAAPDWARPRGHGSGSLGAGASSPGTAAAMLLRRLQVRPGPAALDGRRVPAAARHMEVRALPGAMLDCYDSLWHGSSGIVASQS